MGNFFTDMFSSNVKGEGFEEIPLTTEQKQAQTFLGQLLGPAPTIPRAGVAGATGTEQAGFSVLDQLVKGGEGSSTEYFRNVANSPVDITKQPEYKAIIDRIMEEGNETLNSLQRRHQLQGAATSTGAGKALGRQFEKTQDRLVGSLAPAAQSAIQRRDAAALQVDQLEKGRVAASQMLTLERQLQQQGIDSETQARLMEILFPYQQQTNVANALLGNQSFLYNPGTVSDPTGPIVGEMAGAIAKGFLL